MGELLTLPLRILHDQDPTQGKCRQDGCKDHHILLHRVAACMVSYQLLINICRKILRKQAENESALCN